MDVVLQSEASECGLAALATVAGHHGHRVSLPELRRRFSLSLKGVSLLRLIDIAGRLGLECRALRLELEELTRLRTPCILHWGLDHFVVLAEAGRKKVTILDPAIGRRRLSYLEVSEQFTGVAMELEPAADFSPRKAAPAVSVRQLAGNVSGLRRALALILLLSMALQVFVALAPLFMQWVVDQVLVSADRDLLTALALGFALVLLLQVGTGLLRGWAVIYLSTRLGLQWMGNVFGHLLRLPLEFFEKRHLGDVISRMGSVQAIQNVLTTSFVEAIIDGLMAMLTLALMLFYSWKLALVTLLAVALYLALRALTYRPVRERTGQQLVAAARQQSHLLESIRGMQSVKVAGSEPARHATFVSLMNETVNHEIRLARLDLGFGSASQLIFGAERILVIWLAALLVLQNAFSVGMLVAYLAYKDQFAQRIASLIDKWVELRMLRLHGERLADIVLAEPEVSAARSMDRPLPDSMRLEVRGLAFRYAEGEPWILRDCTFDVADGESVALVGASGCGKTTLLKLLLGLLEPTEGSILIGGRDLLALGPQNYRRIVGAVMQDDRLFAESVARNIAFGEERCDLERVEAAARRASVHDEIAAMPMGYHTLIGDMGSALSGGQQQRIVLARALYRQPRMLFLDEATSHLDIEREHLVNEAVRALQLTRVIVAHRPQTVLSADRALVLHGGRVVQELRPQQFVAPASSSPDDRL